MNILGSQQMKQKEKKLILLYNQSNMKFKLNLQQLIEAKQKKRDLFFFRKADKDIKLWIKKLVPLNKRVQTISVQQQENGLFKALTYIFLLVIYKNKDQPNQYVKDQIKCSLYSDDIDLLEVRNHSFNKKMRSDNIKSVIAYFFKQIQYLLQTGTVKTNKIKPEELIAMALQKNDMVTEGFHLFYRNILAKLEVENSNNCIEQVSPEEALSNLIQYFQIECRVFNNLYMFNDAGVFIAQVQNQNLVFGRYYQNELELMQTSEEEKQSIRQPLKIQIKKGSTFLLKQDQIEKQDVRIFNFILDTERKSLEDSRMQLNQRGNQVETPCFISNGEELKFGRKKIYEHEKQLDTSLNKIKNRLQRLRINEIQSEEQDYEIKNQSLTPFLGRGPNNFKFQPNQNNIIFNLNAHDQDSQQEEQFQGSDQAPTPMLGGADFLNFGNKEKAAINISNLSSERIQSNMQNVSSFFAPHNMPEDNIIKKSQNLNLKTKIKWPTARRQSYQEQNSSKSKSQQNKKIEMKTSKNQIKVIDQTASRASHVNINQAPKKNADQYFKDRKQTIRNFQKSSSYSNCSCHIQKKTRIKLESQILEMIVESKDTKYQVNFTKKKSTELLYKEPQKINSPMNSGFQIKKYTFVTDNHIRQHFKTQVQPTNKNTGKYIQKGQKRQQFINFLKKDKSQLIKKLSQKRQAKQIMYSGQNEVSKYLYHHQNNDKQDRKYVKQSMFVGTYNLQNPENKANGRNQKTGAITPNHSMDKKFEGGNEGRQRSITPPPCHNFKSRIQKQGNLHFKTNGPSHKNSVNQTNFANYGLLKNNISEQNFAKGNFVYPNQQKVPISFKAPFFSGNKGSIRTNTQPVNVTDYGNNDLYKR